MQSSVIFNVSDVVKKVPPSCHARHDTKIEETFSFLRDLALMMMWLDVVIKIFFTPSKINCAKCPPVARY